MNLALITFLVLFISIHLTTHEAGVSMAPDSQMRKLGLREASEQLVQCSPNRQPNSPAPSVPLTVFLKSRTDCGSPAPLKVMFLRVPGALLQPPFYVAA